VGQHGIERLLLSALAGGQGLAALLIDLNRTHAANPSWTGHARFHVVWQVSTDALLALFTLALLWWTGPYPDERFYLAALLTAFPMLGFVFALATRALYGGTLHDPIGIPPVRLRIGGRLHEFDMNTVIVFVALLLLAGVTLSFRF
jgi:hypothetical protein